MVNFAQPIDPDNEARALMFDRWEQLTDHFSIAPGELIIFDQDLQLLHAARKIGAPAVCRAMTLFWEQAPAEAKRSQNKGTDQAIGRLLLDHFIERLNAFIRSEENPDGKATS